MNWNVLHKFANFREYCRTRKLKKEFMKVISKEVFKCAWRGEHQFEFREGE